MVWGAVRPDRESLRRRYCANDSERIAIANDRRQAADGRQICNVGLKLEWASFGGLGLEWATRYPTSGSIGTTVENDGGEEARRRRRGEARRGENSRNGGEPNIGKCRRATGHVRTVDERDRGGDRADE